MTGLVIGPDDPLADAVRQVDRAADQANQLSGDVEDLIERWGVLVARECCGLPAPGCTMCRLRRGLLVEKLDRAARSADEVAATAARAADGWRRVADSIRP